jgi:hypothetical protein
MEDGTVAGADSGITNTTAPTTAIGTTNTTNPLTSAEKKAVGT